MRQSAKTAISRLKIQLIKSRRFVTTSNSQFFSRSLLLQPGPTSHYSKFGVLLKPFTNILLIKHLSICKGIRKANEPRDQGHLLKH